MDTRSSTSRSLRIALLFLLAPLCSFSFGQVGYQLAWDVSNIPDATRVRLQVAAPDGGQYVVLRIGTGRNYNIYRLGADGEPIWGQEFAAINAFPFLQGFHSLDGGDVLINEVIGLGTVNNEIIVNQHRLRRIDPDGQVIWAKEYDVTLEHTFAEPHWTNGRIVSDNEGNIFIVDVYYGGFSRTWVRKFSSDGTLLWVRSVRSSPGSDALYEPALHDAKILAEVDGEGGLILGGSGFSGLGELFLWRLDALGELAWSKKFRFTNNVYNESFAAIATSTQGVFLASGRMVNSTGSFIINYRIGIDGTLLSGDLYSAYPDILKLLSMPNGNMLLVGDRPSFMDGSNSLRLLELDPTGAVVQALDRTQGYLAPDLIDHFWTGASIAGDQLVVAGDLVTENESTGFRTFRPIALSFPLSAPFDGCLITPRSVTRTPIPIAIISSTDTDLYSIDMSSSTSITSATVQPVAAPLPTTLDLCSISIGLETLVFDDRSFTILGNPTAAGEELMLQGLRKGGLSMYNATGALISEREIAAHTEHLAVATTGLHAGVYLLRWIAADGHQQRTQRVVLR